MEPLTYSQALSAVLLGNGMTAMFAYVIIRMFQYEKAKEAIPNRYLWSVVAMGVAVIVIALAAGGAA